MTDRAHLARLAGLNLGDETGKELQAGLDRILEMVEVLRAAELPSDTEPLRHPLELGQRTRQDQVGDAGGHTDVVEGSPDHEAGLFLVPRVLD